jgi:hypothetical protein
VFSLVCLYLMLHDNWKSYERGLVGNTVAAPLHRSRQEVRAKIKSVSKAAELGVPVPYLVKAPHVEACIAGLVHTIIRPTSGVCFKAVKHAVLSSVRAVLLHYRAKWESLVFRFTLPSNNARVSKHFIIFHSTTVSSLGSWGFRDHITFCEN